MNMATRENYKHRVLLNLAASVFFLCATALFADSPKEHFEQLVKRGGGFVADTTAEEGQFVLAVSAVSLNLKVKNSNQLLEMARLIAQRDIAGFFGKKINSRNETRQEVITVRVDEAQKSKVKKVLETFESVHRVDIDQVLMGAEVFDTRHHAGELYVGFLLSDKRLKVVVKLRDASTLTGVVAIGLATVDKNGKVEDARKRAIENAKRSAVEQAFGSVVQGSTQIQKLDPGTFKSKLYTSSFGSVTSYKVMEPQSGSNGVVYKVKIIATVSKKISLEKIVAAWQNNGASFWIDPGKNPNNPGQDLLIEFAEFFELLGFRVTERKQEADYHISLNTRFVDRKNPFNNLPVTQLRMNVEIKDPKVGVNFIPLMRNNEKLATSQLNNPTDRKLDCARKACKQMAPELKKRIGKMVMDQLQNGREVRVSFMGGKNLDGKGYHFIKDIIDWMPGVQNCNKSIQEANREVRYTLRYGGSLDLLQSTLSSELVKHFPDNHPRLEKMGANEIVYHVRKNKDPEKIGKSTRELARLGLAAVLRLDIFKDGKRIGHGSGFLIAPDIAVTNEHVIRGGNGGFVKHPGNKKQFAIEEILMVDKINDIALIRVANTGGIALELGDAANVAIGDRVYSVGSPTPKGQEKFIGNLDGTFTQGIISAIRPVPNTDVRVFQYTAPTDHGSSGGPIINNQGKVIAVHKWGFNAQLANAGAPVNYLKDLLRKNKLDK